MEMLNMKCSYLNKYFESWLFEAASHWGTFTEDMFYPYEYMYKGIEGGTSRFHSHNNNFTSKKNRKSRKPHKSRKTTKRLKHTNK